MDTWILVLLFVTNAGGGSGMTSLYARRDRMRIAPLIVALMLSGCTAIYASRVPPAPPSKDFNAMTCDQLLMEKARIEAGYLEHNARMKANTRHALAHLNGDAIGVNDAARFNGCKIETVRVLKRAR